MKYVSLMVSIMAIVISIASIAFCEDIEYTGISKKHRTAITMSYGDDGGNEFYYGDSIHFSKTASITVVSEQHGKIEFKNVISTTDGSGNDEFKAFEYSEYDGIIEVASLSFEHEGAYIVGNVSFPTFTKNDSDKEFPQSWENTIVFHEGDIPVHDVPNDIKLLWKLFDDTKFASVVSESISAVTPFIVTGGGDLTSIKGICKKFGLTKTDILDVAPMGTKRYMGLIEGRLENTYIIKTLNELSDTTIVVFGKEDTDTDSSNFKKNQAYMSNIVNKLIRHNTLSKTFYGGVPSVKELYMDLSYRHISHAYIANIEQYDEWYLSVHPILFIGKNSDGNWVGMLSLYIAT